MRQHFVDDDENGRRRLADRFGEASGALHGAD